MQPKPYSASEWKAEFIAEWIDLSQGRAAGANFDGLVGRVYPARAQEDPREVARQEWGPPAKLKVIEPSATSSSRAQPENRPLMLFGIVALAVVLIAAGRLIFSAGTLG